MTLRLDGVSKEFGKNDSYQKVLDNISIEFKSGEFVCVLGESGSGKSTFLNIVGGLDSNYSGSVNIDNMNLKYIDIDRYRKDNIGFVFQNFNLINSLSIVDNIILPIDKCNYSYKEKKKKAIDLLKKLNIYNYRKKKIVDLSGGQKQRVAIARALINDPSILLCDEPTGALDEKNSIGVLEILKEINLEGKLVIVVTHSEKVINYSTRVINIKDGKIFSDKKIKRVKESVIDKDEVKENNLFYLIKYGIRNLFNNKKRNFLIIISSSIGIIGIILSLFIGSSVKGYMKDLILDKSNPYIYSVKKKESISNKYSSDEIKDISSIDGIKKVYKEISYNVSKVSMDDKDYDLLYTDSFNKIDLEYGDDSGLVVSKYFVSSNGFNNKSIIGKNVILTLMDDYNIISIDTYISGIAKNSSFSLVDDTMHAFIKYSVLKEEYEDDNLELLPSNITVLVDKNYEYDDLKYEFNKMKLDISNNNDLYDELNSYFDIATFVLSMFSSLSLLVSVIMISIIISITVIERTKEIGILRSIGYSKKDIKYIFNSEALFLGLSIGLFSSVMSNFIIRGIRGIVKDRYSISFNVSVNKYYVFGIWLSILLILISSYFPSRKASNYDPIKSLKYE